MKLATHKILMSINKIERREKNFQFFFEESQRDVFEKFQAEVETMKLQHAKQKSWFKNIKASKTS